MPHDAQREVNCKERVNRLNKSTVLAHLPQGHSSFSSVAVTSSLYSFFLIYVMNAPPGNSLSPDYLLWGAGSCNGRDQKIQETKRKTDPGLKHPMGRT